MSEVGAWSCLPSYGASAGTVIHAIIGRGLADCEAATARRILRWQSGCVFSMLLESHSPPQEPA